MHLLTKKTATVALGLRPCIVIVSNRSTQAIVAFTVVWKVTYGDGKTNTTEVPFKYPDALAGIPEISRIADSREGLSVLSGESRVVGKEFELGSSWDADFYLNQLRAYAEDQKKELVAAKQIEVDLDAAIFSDGLLVGPNHTNLDQDFMVYFGSKQKLFRQIVNDLDAGQSVDQAFAPLKTLADNHASGRDRTAFYEMLAAQQINALRTRLGDSDVGEAARQAVRKEAFVIRRISAE